MYRPQSTLQHFSLIAQSSNAFGLQLVFCVFHSFLGEEQMNAGYSIHMGRMHNNNLEIRIAGSSCRLQKVKEVPQIIDGS